jgi:putative transposase
MPRRHQQFAVGETYHVYNRGVDRQPIFFEPDNWAFFLRKVREYLLGEPRRARSTPGLSKTRGAGNRAAGRGVDVLAYCLMPNHYHLVVRLLADDFSCRMQRLSLSYTNAINRARSRVGPLFQGPFRAVLVEEESHLLHLTRYVHRNPDAAHLVASPAEWDFSSYRDYLGLRSGSLPSPEIVLQEFGSPEAYRRFVEGHAAVPAGFEAIAIDAKQ